MAKDLYEQSRLCAGTDVAMSEWSSGRVVGKIWEYYSHIVFLVVVIVDGA